MLKSKTPVGLLAAFISICFVFCIIKIASAGYQFGRWLNRNTVQKVAGTLRVPSAEPQKALLFEGYGTWNVPTTLLHGTVPRLNPSPSIVNEKRE